MNTKEKLQHLRITTLLQSSEMKEELARRLLFKPIELPKDDHIRQNLIACGLIRSK